MSDAEYQREYKRRRRALDPEYAQRSREQSLAAKRRRRGVCELCGGETRYNGNRINGPSSICAACNVKRNHEERRWTRETIVRAFRRFHAELGRQPTTADSMGTCESLVLGLSGRRIREIEQVQELGLALPRPSAVYREFGTWAAALEAAGFTVSRGGGGTHRRRYVGG